MFPINIMTKNHVGVYVEYFYTHTHTHTRPLVIKLFSASLLYMQYTRELTCPPHVTCPLRAVIVRSDTLSRRSFDVRPGSFRAAVPAFCAFEDYTILSCRVIAVYVMSMAVAREPHVGCAWVSVKLDAMRGWLVVGRCGGG